MNNGKKPADVFKTLQKIEEALAEVELTATTDDEEYKLAVRKAIMRKILEQTKEDAKEWEKV